jgi:hypothetical protein
VHTRCVVCTGFCISTKILTKFYSERIRGCSEQSAEDIHVTVEWGNYIMRTFIIRSFYMILLSLLSQRRWFSGVCNMSEENNECILNFYWKTSWENSWAYLIHKRLLLRLILEEFIWNLYIGFNSLRKAGLGSFIFRVIEFLDHLLRVQRKLYCVMLRCCFPRVGN